MITHHTQLLNALIEKLNPLFDNDPHYMEIGVQDVEKNFNKINCRRKIGIDPAVKGINIYTGTSDQYFKDAKEFLIKGKDRGDGMAVIFIDGDHTAPQAKRDFENALEVLSDNGFILLHDTLPIEESTTHVPRDSRIWHGDVYKFAMTLCNYPGIDYKTFNIDNGCTLVWKVRDALPINEFVPIGTWANWTDYKLYGEALLNVTAIVEI